MDYHVGQKIKVTMRTGFHAGKIVDRNVMVEKTIFVNHVRRTFV